MNLRAADLDTAAFIDALRAEFGADAITAQIRKGMQGLPGFFHYRGPAGEAGTPFPPSRNEVSGADMVLGDFNPKKEVLK